MIALALLVQIAIIPMNVDSVAATTDSVSYKVTWGYQFGNKVPVTFDSLRFWWGKYPNSPRTKKLTGTTKTITVKFPHRQGWETTLRVMCLRAWSKNVPTLRCVSRGTKYLYSIDVKPDSVTLQPGP